MAFKTRRVVVAILLSGFLLTFTVVATAQQSAETRDSFVTAQPYFTEPALRLIEKRSPLSQAETSGLFRLLAGLRRCWFRIPQTREDPCTHLMANSWLSSQRVQAMATSIS